MRGEKNELNTTVNYLVKQMSDHSSECHDDSGETLETKIIRFSEEILEIEDVIKYHELRISHFHSKRSELIFSVEELKSEITQ